VQILAIELHALFWDRNGLQMLEGNSISPEPCQVMMSLIASHLAYLQPHKMPKETLIH
jgi:hypothetical protein